MDWARACWHASAPAHPGLLHRRAPPRAGRRRWRTTRRCRAVTRASRALRRRTRSELTRCALLAAAGLHLRCACECSRHALYGASPSQEPLVGDGVPPLTLRLRRWGHVIEAGPLYVHVRRSTTTVGTSLGVDLSLHDATHAPWLLLRAMLVEFLGTTALLFFSITTIVYREAYAHAAGVMPACTAKSELTLRRAVQLERPFKVQRHLRSASHPAAGLHQRSGCSVAADDCRRIRVCDLRGRLHRGAYQRRPHQPGCARLDTSFGAQARH